MARSRGIDLTTPRTLRIVEELDGFSCVLLDKERTKALGKQIFMFHLAMMAAFLTIIGAPFAWVAALLNIVLSPKVAFWRLECSQHAVTLTSLAARAEPGVADATKNTNVVGPKVLGTGTAPPPTTLPFSEVTDLGWTDHSLWFLLRDGQRHELLLELTSPDDIARLGAMVQDTWRRFSQGVTMSAEEADENRRRLGALLQRPQGT